MLTSWPEIQILWLRVCLSSNVCRVLTSLLSIRCQIITASFISQKNRRHSLTPRFRVRGKALEQMDFMDRVLKTALFFIPEMNVPRAIRKKQKANAPKPLPSKRKRALSIPAGIDLRHFEETQNPLQDTFKRKQSLSTQQQSNLFLLLPLEVRRNIWSYCIGYYVLHLVRESKKLVAIQCCGEEEDARWPPCAHLCWGQSSNAFPGYHGICPGYLLGTNGCALFPDPIPLLQTCRMV